MSGEYGIGYTNKGETFYFDLEDYDKIKDYCWSFNEFGYLRANALKPNWNKNIRMHRLIMGVLDNNEVVIDHINHKTNDNRKCNLRICTELDNNKNQILSKSNTTGVKGVSYSKQHNKYEAYITVNGKRKALGLYKTLNEATKVRKEAEEKYQGKYSYDNSMKYASEQIQVTE